MARDVTDLAASAWTMGPASRQPFSVQPCDDRTAVTGWLPARVPGDVRADLLASGQVLTLDSPEGVAASAWVDDADWWYRTEIDTVEPGAHVVLEADGIDYLSAVYLDDQLLATHQGMFARQSIVLPAQVQQPGRHEIAVRIWGTGALPRLPSSFDRRFLRKLLFKLGVSSEYFPDRMATPKAQFSFGWDFAPRVLSTGIWDEIRLVRSRGAYLADVHAQAEPLSPDADPTPVHWTVRLRVVRFGSARLRADLTLHTAEGESIPLPQSQFDLAGDQEELITFESSSLARWWPWDQGEPRLYRLTTRLIDERGPVDEVETVVGVRSVRRERFSNGSPWRFMLNHRPVFLRGANWVPADILPGRVGKQDYEQLIGQARAAGINFLRVWGGGIREKRSFWEQCDERGIMAMQEFPLACAFLDHYPRGAGYLSVLESEAEGIVTGLRSHPSLIAWCGGNEISPQRERRPLRTIERVLQREDPARPWMPASPSQGDVHQWDVWHGSAPWQSLARVRLPFMSEFGLQALPHAETLHEMFPSGVPASLDDERWSARKLQAGKLRHYAGPLVEGDLVVAVAASQRTQAAGLQVGVEACRLRREGSGNPRPCGGLAIWQLNEPWPVVSWSVIDRRGREKAAYSMLTRSYQPLLVAARFEWRAWQAGQRFSAEVWLVNDAPRAQQDCVVEAALDGRRVHLTEAVSIGPGSARRVSSLDTLLERSPSLLELVCSSERTVIAENRYELDVYLPPRQPLGAWVTRRVADLFLR